ncbi:MAG: rod shape-determining protein MreC [Candidatus Omnitrophota bacterium]
MLKTFFKTKIWLFIPLIAVLVFLFLSFPSFTSGLKNISLRVFLIPEKVRVSLAQYFRSKNDLIRVNRALQEELARLSLEAERLKDLKYENERLRELLDLKKELEFNTVSAEIIARNPNDWIGSIYINRGSADGIEKNSAVCSAKGLLGKIVEVNKDSSSAMLMTHPNFRAGGMVRESRISGIVEGAGRGMVRMLYIPMDADVEEGSVVVTSGYSRIFPEGIGIGRIISVNKSKTGLYKYAVIKPFANPFEQKEVLCIR